MRISKPLALAALSLLAIGCGDGSGTTPRVDTALAGDGHSAVYDPSIVPSDSASRRLMENGAIAAILDRTPKDRRTEIAKFLEIDQRGAVTQLVGSSDPEIARQLATIQSIRGVETQERMGRLRDARRVGDGNKKVPVLVALAPTPMKQGVRGAVVRRPDDGGTPLILLPENGPTPADLDIALRLAAQSVERHGVTVKNAVRMEFRAGNAFESSIRQSDIAALKAARVRDVPGLGKVRALDMQTTPSRTRVRRTK